MARRRCPSGVARREVRAGTSVLDTKPWVILDSRDCGTASDGAGNKYALNVQTWAYKGSGFGLHLQARNITGCKVTHDIVLNLPYRDMILCDDLNRQESGESSQAPRPFKWSKVRRTFVDACKDAIRHGRVAQPDVVLVEPASGKANLLHLRWCAVDESGRLASNPLLFEPESAREIDPVTCAEEPIL